MVKVVYVCPNCDVAVEEKNGCLFSFLFFPLLVILPVVFGVIASHLHASFNLGSWMFANFPTGSWYTQGLWHFAIVIVVSAVLSALLINKVFRVRVYHRCPSCHTVWARKADLKYINSK